MTRYHDEDDWACWADWKNDEAKLRNAKPSDHIVFIYADDPPGHKAEREAQARMMGWTIIYKDAPKCRTAA